MHISAIDAINVGSLYIEAHKIVWSGKPLSEIIPILQRIEISIKLSNFQTSIHDDIHHAIQQNSSRKSIAECILQAQRSFTIEARNSLSPLPVER